DLGGLDDMTMDTMHQLLHVEADEWLKELPAIKSFYSEFGAKLPKLLWSEVEELEKRLQEVEIAPPTTNKKLLNWIEQVRTMCQPEKIHWCTGTDDEYEEMC